MNNELHDQLLRQDQHNIRPVPICVLAAGDTGKWRVIATVPLGPVDQK